MGNLKFNLLHENQLAQLCFPCSNNLNQQKVEKTYIFLKFKFVHLNKWAESQPVWKQKLLSWISRQVLGYIHSHYGRSITVKICQCEHEFVKIVNSKFMISRIHSYPTHSGDAGHKYSCRKSFPPFQIIKCQIMQHCNKPDADTNDITTTPQR